MEEEKLKFRTATSSGNNGGCLAVARDGDMMVVRDSKDPDGPTLRFTLHEWACATQGFADGEFAPERFVS